MWAPASPISAYPPEEITAAGIFFAAHADRASRVFSAGTIHFGGDLLDGSIGLQPQDFLSAGIDGVNLSFVAVGLQIDQNFIPGLSRCFGCPDHRDTFRLKKIFKNI
jgi:hypothetical protein